MRHFRPLPAGFDKALAELDSAEDPNRAALERLVFELETSRLPVRRHALELLLLRRLLAAVRRMPRRPRAVQKILDAIPALNANQEWARLSAAELPEVQDLLGADNQKRDTDA